MNPNAAVKGRSFKGAIAYIIHDPDQAETDERVLFTATQNMRTNDPEKAAKVMAYTAMHAAELKSSAGIKATGRKTDSPVYHLSLSWVPGENPTKAEMIEAGQAALKCIGYQDHEAVFAAHGDKAHKHLHIVVNRIDPITGKTHNPKDDHKFLQAWGHEYDKARGLEWRSPDRAAIHEKDPVKKAEYQEKAKSAKSRGGESKASKPRPEWKAEKGATHPKSGKYQEIKATYAERVKALSAASRETATRHRSEWSAIKERHAKERSGVLRRQAGHVKLGEQFTEAATGPKRLAWRAKFGALKASQRTAMREARAEAKRQNEPAVSQFLLKLDEERKAFLKDARAEDRRNRNDLRLAMQRPVGQQDKDFRGHLAKAFNRKAEGTTPQADFRHHQEKQKATFFAALATRDRPVLDKLAAGHATDVAVLRDRMRLEKEPGGPKRRDRQMVRAELAATQRQERTALRTRQGEERQGIQGQWAQLNEDRAGAWQQYRDHRANQAKAKPQEAVREPGLKDRFQERAATPAEPKPSTGRNYSGGQSETARADPGRERSRKP